MMVTREVVLLSLTNEVLLKPCRDSQSSVSSCVAKSSGEARSVLSPSCGLLEKDRAQGRHRTPQPPTGKACGVGGLEVDCHAFRGD